MRTIWRVSSILVAGLLLLTLAACSDEQTPAEGAAPETALEHAQAHLDPKYVCPMHSNIIRDKPGSCPICGMTLVEKKAQPQATAQGSGERRILFYRNPMNPAITSKVPMKDDMGMDYIPVYADEGGDDGATVTISPVVQNNLGVRTAPVQVGKLWRRIYTVGYVDFNENLITHIHLRTQGWIEKLLVKSEGERVKKGQLLFEVYSPELVNAQEEYIQAMRTGNQRLIRASRERLTALGFSRSQIRKLSKTREINQYVKVYASQDGIIEELSIREGMFVTPKMKVMSLADLSSVWLLAEVFESQADWVKVGQNAEVRLGYLPGLVWEGKVEYIYPNLDPKTRTLRARLRFDNPGESLKPGMFAAVHIYGGAKEGVISIPREALIRTGSEERVIIALGEGRFAARPVVAGIESGDYIEIKEGLAAGETVVTSAQFLIDSEASLKASLARMTAPQAAEPAAAPAEHDMGAMAVMGMGVVREVLADEARIKLTHDPIPALEWPEMTMFFNVAEDVDLSAFKPKDKVHFELEETTHGYVIKAIKKLD